MIPCFCHIRRMKYWKTDESESHSFTPGEDKDWCPPNFP